MPNEKNQQTKQDRSHNNASQIVGYPFQEAQLYYCFETTKPACYLAKSKTTNQPFKARVSVTQEA